MKTKTISQWIYGSTPWSAGYSILAQSENLESNLVNTILSYCENYDNQKHVLPPYDYSFCIYHINKEIWIFMETFGGWKDQVGRDSRVIRSTLFDKETIQAMQGNPFLLSWLLPPVSSCIPKKRNETAIISDIPLETVQKYQNKLWHKETKFFFKILSSLSTIEKQFLFSLQQKGFPFTPCEIAVQKDTSLLSRAIVYAISQSKRMDCQIDSFSTNNAAPKGLCFRFAPYCKEPKDISSFAMDTKLDLNLRWEMATLVHSIPEPELFYVMQKRYIKFSWLPYILFCILFLTLITYYMLNSPLNKV